MATIDTIANNYDSDQDEEYAPVGGASSDESDSEAGEVDEDEDGSSRGSKKRGKGKKRKAKAPAGPLTLKKRAFNMKSKKKKKEDQIGAAVISDDEDDEEQPPPPPQQQQQQQQQQEEEEVEDEEQEENEEQQQQQEQSAQSSSSNASSDSSAATASTSSTSASIPASTSASESTSTSTSASTPSSTSTSSAPSKPTSLAALMAQINKKPSANSKAPVKKANPWAAPASSKLDSLLASVPSATKTSSTNDVDERMKETQTTIKEVATFAGSQIHITRTIEKGSEEEAKHKAAKAARSNLDSILDAIKGKRELTTVDKSKLDWQVSKDKEGDAHELQQYTKNGYVSSMAFLKRAETREAEIMRLRRAGGDRAERKAQMNMSELED